MPIDATTLNTLISAGSGVCVGLAGMYIHASQLGKRLDDTNQNLRDFRSEFNVFRDNINSKLSDLDREVTGLLGKLP